MKFKIVSILAVVFLLMSFNVPKGILKKIEKEIKATYDIEAYQFINIDIDPEITKILDSDFTKNNLFKIEANGEFLGYAYLGQAPSKTAQFDYLVLLDTDLVIKKSKVLAYREEYGGEIGSKRWLKQFIGKTAEDSLKYGDNIMAISGATISVRSMTNAINNLLQSLKVLHNKNII
ncbi:FMN-binding protein [Seonamhaeicola maritimus]|uniref:FMN-binding protein n=1 Tax=Seonamhaeicola maritimus TaxID=2591822 RepID=A0A5C7GKV7_9FLAO|nr:FMN-binding protein [Seonamhaeicola maritimus]TXG38912.1 FMN-binding protein [Seonamhaeicola maritimus]